MSLVGYGSSSEEDSSDRESEDHDQERNLERNDLDNSSSNFSERSTQAELGLGPGLNTNSAVPPDEGSSPTSGLESRSSLFTALPRPKSQKVQDVGVEEEIESEIQRPDSTVPNKRPLSKLNLPPPKKRGQRVKIEVPSLPEPDSDDEEEHESKQSNKGKGISGLFSLLPDPKYKTGKEANRLLIPYALTKKKTPPLNAAEQPSMTSTNPQPQVISKTGGSPSISKPSLLGLSYGSEEEEEIEESTLSSNFFSFEEKSYSTPTRNLFDDKPSNISRTLQRAETSEVSNSSKSSDVMKSSNNLSQAFQSRQFPNTSIANKPTVNVPKLQPEASLSHDATRTQSKLASSYVGITSHVHKDEKGVSSIRSVSKKSEPQKSQLVPSSAPSSSVQKSKVVPSSAPDPSANDLPLTTTDPSMNDVPLSFSRSSVGRSRVQQHHWQGPLSSSASYQPVQYQGPQGYQDQRGTAEYESPAGSYSFGQGQESVWMGGPSVSSSHSGTADMQNLQFQRMVGKKNHGREEINIIDIKADDHLGTTRPEEWLIKSMSEEKQARTKLSKEQLPTTQQRKKHQITYLARQAKERELELKNSWADNRMSRKQTQAKYGF